MSASAMYTKSVPKHIQGRTIIATLPKKLAKRAILSQNQHARRLKRVQEQALAAKRIRERQETSRRNAHFRQQVRNARAWRKEDWIKGPLAPKRDAGVDAETFGAIQPMQLYGVEKAEYKQWGIVAGDRVCVIRKGHRECGKIGRVREVREKAEEVIVEGVNKANVVVPEYMLVKETDKTRIRPYEASIPLRDVRLVATLADPSTGKLRDHIVNELTLEKITRREKKGLDPPTRYITALEPAQAIPYPPKPDETETAEEYENDTLRIQVDDATWVPTMHMPPMPPAVLDELRNKFSKFRIRHDETYLDEIAKKDRKVLKQERKVNMMLTPIKQRRRIERKEREALGRPELGEGVLAAIGELMERNAERAVREGRDVLPPTPGT